MRDLDLKDQYSMWAEKPKRSAKGQRKRFFGGVAGNFSVLHYQNDKNDYANVKKSEECVGDLK